MARIRNRKPLTDEQRAAQRERQRKYRASGKARLAQKAYRERHRERLLLVQREANLVYYYKNLDAMRARAKRTGHARYLKTHPEARTLAEIQAAADEKRAALKARVEAQQRQWAFARSPAGAARRAAVRKEYKERTRHIWNEYSKARTAMEIGASPGWANKFFMQEAYDLARLRTKVTGYAWHVDHVVPLKSKLVCGLHCEQNLAVIPGAVNCSKRNLYWPDMP